MSSLDQHYKPFNERIDTINEEINEIGTIDIHDQS